MTAKKRTQLTITKSRLTRFFLLLSLLTTNAFAGEVTGKWQTIDDETEQAKAIVEISQNSDGTLSGKILTLYQKPDAICSECEGDKKDKPIVGMVILWNLSADGKNHWSGGTILDPKKGTEYDVKMTLSDDGQSLSVRGFAGISLLGRTQVWKRL